MTGGSGINRHLEPMGTVDLAELDRAQLHDRVESKVILRQSDLGEALDRLVDDYLVFEHDGERLQSYRTEYFDDVLLRDYHDHHNQKQRRMKVRYRSYLNSDLTYFEVKQSIGGRTVKTRRLSTVPIGGVLSAEDGLFLYQSTRRDPSELFPSLTVDYQRILLVKKDFSERVTIDIDIRFAGEERGVRIDDLAICEFKQETFDRRSPAMVAMQRRPQMFSKYCMGLASCNPMLRRNRFKKVFRQLAALDVTNQHLETVS